jgi:hypothetical protein
VDVQQSDRLLACFTILNTVAKKNDSVFFGRECIILCFYHLCWDFDTHSGTKNA